MTESVSFDRAARYYDATRGFPEGVAEHVGKFVAKAGQLDKESRVLEVGVGTGRIAIPVSQNVGYMFGVDISEGMLRVLLTNKVTDNLAPVQGDATMLPFPDNTFDAVMATHIFHLIPNWAHALREVQRVLKPGSPLLHCFNGATEIWELRRKAFVKIFEPDNVGVKWQDISEFIPKAGWTRTHKARYEYEYRQAPESLVEQLQNRTWSSTWRMSDEDIQQAVEHLNAILEEEFEDPSLPIDVTGSFNVVVFQQPGL